jgi:hypothetical protein
MEINLDSFAIDFPIKLEASAEWGVSKAVTLPNKVSFAADTKKSLCLSMPRDLITHVSFFLLSQTIFISPNGWLGTRDSNEACRSQNQMVCLPCICQDILLTLFVVSFVCIGKKKNFF